MLRVPLLAVFLAALVFSPIANAGPPAGLCRHITAQECERELAAYAAAHFLSAYVHKKLRPDITQGETLFCHLRRRSTPWVFRCGDTLGSPAACTVQALVKRDRADVFRIVWTNE